MSATLTTTITTSPSASSARCGTAKRGCTAARNPGSSRSRAIANVVRPTPAIRLNSTPRLAATAPTCTNGANACSEPARTASCNGAALDAVPSAPSTDNTPIPTSA